MPATPKSFSDCFGRFSMEQPTNQTTRSLSQDPMAQGQIQALLHRWGMDDFVPLAGAGASCQISLPLYAGDGLVVKVTPDGYDSHEDAPYQLPPVRRQIIKGKDDSYAISLWPFLRPAPMGDYAVQTMANKLAAAGYGFTNGDDRVDNLGQLPDGTLAVLDNGAVMRLPGRQPPADQALAVWRATLAAQYPRLYGSVHPVTASQHPETDFTLAPPRWAMAPPEAPALSQGAPRKKWLGLF